MNIGLQLLLTLFLLHVLLVLANLYLTNLEYRVRHNSRLMKFSMLYDHYYGLVILIITQCVILIGGLFVVLLEYRVDKNRNGTTLSSIFDLMELEFRLSRKNQESLDFARLWNVDDITLAERKLAGLCQICGTTKAKECACHILDKHLEKKPTYLKIMNWKIF